MSDIVRFNATRVAVLKTKDHEDRIVEGIASSGEKDVHGEILDPDGARWDTPLPLLSEHDGNAQVGEILMIWKAGGKLRFRAQIDDNETWERVLGRAKVGISVGFDRFADDTDADGTRRVSEWRIKEISIVERPANSECRVEIAQTRRRSHGSASRPETRPLPVVHLSQAKSAEIAEETTAEPRTPPRRTKSRGDGWGVRNLPPPTIPRSLSSLSKAERSEIFGRVMDYQVDATLALAAECGLKPNAFASEKSVRHLVGNLTGGLVWLQHRIADLEARLTEVQERSTHFAGVHQAALDYRRGAMVSKSGGLWVAVRDAGIGDVPGNSPTWQLAVKRGDGQRGHA